MQYDQYRSLDAFVNQRVSLTLITGVGGTSQASSTIRGTLLGVVDHGLVIAREGNQVSFYPWTAFLGIDLDMASLGKAAA